MAVLLLSWGSFANFNPVFAATSEDKLRNLIDDIDIEKGKHSGTPLAVKLQDARIKFQAALDDLKKDPPDYTSAIVNISEAQQEIQIAIDNEGFSPIIGKIMIKALDFLKDKLSIQADVPPVDVPPVDVPPVDVPPVVEKDEKKIRVCHIPPGHPSNFHTISVSIEAWENAHQKHGDMLGDCTFKDKDEVAKKNQKNK